VFDSFGTKLVTPDSDAKFTIIIYELYLRACDQTTPLFHFPIHSSNSNQCRKEFILHCQRLHQRYCLNF